MLTSSKGRRPSPNASVRRTARQAQSPGPPPPALRPIANATAAAGNAVAAAATADGAGSPRGPQVPYPLGSPTAPAVAAAAAAGRRALAGGPVLPAQKTRIYLPFQASRAEAALNRPYPALSPRSLGAAPYSPATAQRKFFPGGAQQGLRTMTPGRNPITPRPPRTTTPVRPVLRSSSPSLTKPVPPSVTIAGRSASPPTSFRAGSAPAARQPSPALNKSTPMSTPRTVTFSVLSTGTSSRSVTPVRLKALPVVPRTRSPPLRNTTPSLEPRRTPTRKQSPPLEGRKVSPTCSALSQSRNRSPSPERQPPRQAQQTTPPKRKTSPSLRKDPRSRSPPQVWREPAKRSDSASPRSADLALKRGQPPSGKPPVVRTGTQAGPPVSALMEAPEQPGPAPQAPGEGDAWNGTMLVPNHLPTSEPGSPFLPLTDDMPSPRTPGSLLTSSFCSPQAAPLPTAPPTVSPRPTLMMTAKILDEKVLSGELHCPTPPPVFRPASVSDPAADADAAPASPTAPQRGEGSLPARELDFGPPGNSLKEMDEIEVTVEEAGSDRSAPEPPEGPPGDNDSSPSHSDTGLTAPPDRNLSVTSLGATIRAYVFPIPPPDGVILSPTSSIASSMREMAASRGDTFVAPNTLRAPSCNEAMLTATGLEFSVTAPSPRNTEYVPEAARTSPASSRGNDHAASHHRKRQSGSVDGHRSVSFSDGVDPASEGAEVTGPGPTTWVCARCYTQNEGEGAACFLCGARRPDVPRGTGWKCKHCPVVNAATSKQCRACHFPRRLSQMPPAVVTSGLEMEHAVSELYGDSDSDSRTVSPNRAQTATPPTGGRPDSPTSLPPTASFPAGSPRSARAPWQCGFCGAISLAAHTCQQCGGPKVEHSPARKQQWQCSACNLYNPHTSPQCRLCGRLPSLPPVQPIAVDGDAAPGEPPWRPLDHQDSDHTPRYRRTHYESEGPNSQPRHLSTISVISNLSDIIHALETRNAEDTPGTPSSRGLGRTGTDDEAALSPRGKREVTYDRERNVSRRAWTCVACGDDNGPSAMYCPTCGTRRP